MEATVRRARFADAREIAELAFALTALHETFDPRRFSRLASIEQAEHFYGQRTMVGDANVWVAELDNRIVGFAYVQFERLNYADLLRNAAWIHDLYVDEAARGRGLGGLLLERSIASAEELGAEKVMLNVAADNRPGRRLFENKGFRVTMAEMMLDLAAKKDND